MKDIVIVSACRTAIGAFGGTLKDTHATTLGSITMKEAIRRAGIDPALIDDVRYGCCLEPSDALNTARVCALMAGIPESCTAVTAIQAEMSDVILAGGVEHMSGIAYSIPSARWGARLQDQARICTSSHHRGINAKG